VNDLDTLDVGRRAALAFESAAEGFNPLIEALENATVVGAIGA
jgi:hypothetical protein